MRFPHQMFVNNCNNPGYILSEPYIRIATSFAVPKNSPFQAPFNKALVITHEMGLAGVWRRQMLDIGWNQAPNCERPGYVPVVELHRRELERHILLIPHFKFMAKDLAHFYALGLLAFVLELIVRRLSAWGISRSILGRRRATTYAATALPERATSIASIFITYHGSRLPVLRPPLPKVE